MVAIVGFIIAALYALAYSSYGYDDTDYGFIQGLSWRVLQGEHPYLDFIYVRPPLSLYLHAPLLVLKEAVWLERVLFYFIMASITWLVTRSLQRYFDFKPIGISPAVFAAMAFMCSVHNYPLEPWHTIDGLLFASLSLYFASKKDTYFYHGLALLFAIASALCKQSFYPLILISPAILAILHGYKRVLPTLIVYSLTLILLVLICILAFPVWTSAFIDQTTGVTSFHDLWEIGFIRYAKPLLFLVIPILVVWRIQARFVLPPFWQNLPAAIAWAMFLGLLMLHVYQAIQTDNYFPPSYGFSQAIFLIAVGVGIKGTWVNVKSFSLLLAFLLVSWCTSISWGYANPMLYFTPILFGFVYGVYDDLELRMPRYFYGILAIFIAWIFAFLNQYPYRDDPKVELSYAAEEIYPRLYNVYTGYDMYHKLKELKELHTEYDQPFTVLPAFPQIHMLAEENNPIPVDWAHNAEADFESQKDFILQELNGNTSVVFIQKDKIDRIYETGRYGSLLSQYVIQNWNKVEEKEFFSVYKNPTADLLYE